MAVSVVNSQTAVTDGGSSLNISTSGLSVGDIMFVWVAKSSVNTGVTAPAGFVLLNQNGTKTHNTFAKYMAVGGDITATNTFTFTFAPARIYGLGIRGADSNFATTAKKPALNAGLQVTNVNWPNITGAEAGSLAIGIVTVTSNSGNNSPVAPLPSGYTDSGQGANNWGFGPDSSRVFYKTNVSGNYDPPDTAPSGGAASDVNYTAGTFNFPVPQGSMVDNTAAGSLSAEAVKTVPATSSMAGTSDMTETATLTANAVVTMSGEGDLSATPKTGRCQACLDSCSCFLAEDGFFSGTLDFEGRNYTTVDGNGSLENPYVIHFLDQDLFRPKTGEISFLNGTIPSDTTFHEVRLEGVSNGVSPGNSMLYESPAKFIIRQWLPNESMFVQANHFIVGASVTFAEAADSASNFRRIVLSTYVQDSILGTFELTIGGQTTPGGGGDPQTLSCQGFVPGLFTLVPSLSTIISPINLYITQNSGSTLALSDIKVWVTAI